jgi:6-phosphogluconolactonase (cycloisomerase 2 family)
MRQVLKLFAVILGSVLFILMTGCGSDCSRLQVTNGQAICPAPPPPADTGGSGSSGSGTDSSGNPLRDQVPPDILYYVGSGEMVAGGITGGQYGGSRTDPAFDLVPNYSTPLPASSTTGGVVHASNKFLYAFSKGAADLLLGWTIDAQAQLTTIFAMPLTIDGPTATAVDPQGRFLFVAASTRLTRIPQVYAYSINSTTGVLTSVAGSPFALPLASSPESLAVDRSGKFLYVAVPTVGGVVGYTIDQGTGVLTLIPTGPWAAQVSRIQASPAGDLLFGISGSVFGAGPDAIHVFNINPVTGDLGAVVGSPFNTLNPPNKIQVNPTGTVIYASARESNHSPIEGYAISPAGVLTALAGSPFIGGWVVGPISSDGTHMYGIGPTVRDAQMPAILVLDVSPTTGALSVSIISMASVAHGDNTLVKLR